MAERLHPGSPKELEKYLLPTEQIMADTLEMCRTDPKFMPIEEFRDSVRAKIAQRPA